MSRGSKAAASGIRKQTCSFAACGLLSAQLGLQILRLETDLGLVDKERRTGLYQKKFQLLNVTINFPLTHTHPHPSQISDEELENMEKYLQRRTKLLQICWGLLQREVT